MTRFFFQPLLHKEKERRKNLRLGSPEVIDERTAKEKMTEETKDNGKTTNITTPGQTKTTVTGNMADRTTDNEPEVKPNNKDSSHNQVTGPGEIAVANSERVAQVYRRTGESGPIPRRLPKTERRRLRVKGTVRGMRNRRFLWERNTRTRRQRRR